MMQREHPVVSIICITYNHEKYIAQALDSFLMQHTDFSVEILVHDDASTDKTIQILKSYAAKHPNIVLVLEQENQFSKGNDGFIKALYARAKGKYLALCEGDDFWTDSEKLQLQVDFLEKHQDYSLSFHPVRVFFEDNSRPETIYPEDGKPSDFTVSKLLERNFIQSNSVVYRAPKNMILPSGVLPLDWYTHLYVAQFGKIGYINRVMAAYRRQPSGVWWGTTNGNLDDIWKKYGLAHLSLFLEIKKLFPKRTSDAGIINQHIVRMFNILLETDKKYHTGLLEQAIRTYPRATEDFMIDKYEHVHNMDVAAATKDKTLQAQQNEIIRLENLLHESETTIRGMQQSRFWKLRNRVLSLLNREI